MPGNTKQLKKDVDQKPAPQYFDPVLDEYGYLYGSNGASRHILYGADGNPITTSGNKLAVRAAEVETQLTTMLARLKSLEDKIDKITSGETPATTQLSGSNIKELGVSWALHSAGVEVEKFSDIEVGGYRYIYLSALGAGTVTCTARFKHTSTTGGHSHFETKNITWGETNATNKALIGIETSISSNQLPVTANKVSVFITNGSSANVGVLLVGVK